MPWRWPWALDATSESMRGPVCFKSLTDAAMLDVEPIHVASSFGSIVGGSNNINTVINNYTVVPVSNFPTMNFD